MRFAVHRPGIPDASPRSHGVSRRDVPSRVHVSVVGETTGRTDEARLTLARLRIHVSACRTSLARKRRFDLFQSAGRFVLQPTHQQSPTGGQDLTVEPSFGQDVPPGILPCAARGSAHGPDLEVFNADNVETPRDPCAGLLHPVLPPVRFPGAHPSYSALGPPAAVRSSLGAGQPSLQALETCALPCGQARNMQQFPGRQSSRHDYSAVDTHGLAVLRWRDRIRNGREGHMPPPCVVQGHPIGLRAHRHVAGPAEPHPSGLRYPNLADMAGQAAHVPLLSAPPYDPEPLMPSGLAPRRSTSWVLRVEERGRCLGEIPQRLLLHRLGTCSQPWELRPSSGELPALLHIARSALSAGTPMLVLLDGQVPDEPGMGAVVPQHRFLGGRRTQPVPRHTNTLSIDSDISKEVKRRVLPV